MEKRALISVSDKTGVVEFARELVRKHGYTILSTGGTAKLLAKEGIPVTEVSDYTGFPEMMIVVGDCEVDESDSDMIYLRAVEAGVEVEYKKYKGMFHDFLYVVPFLKESKQAWRDIEKFIAEA